MSSEPSAPSAPPPDGGENESRLHIRGIREMPAGHDEQLATIFKEMRRASGLSQEQIAGRLATKAETIGELESGAILALPEWVELERIVTAYTAQLGLDARPILRRLKAQIIVEEPLVTPPPAPAGSPPPAAPSARPPSARPPGVKAPPPVAPPMPPSAAPPAPARTVPPQSPPPQAQARAAPGIPPEAAPARRQAQPPASEAEKAKPRPGRLARSLRPILNWTILLGFVAALGAGVWYAAKRPRMVWSALDSLPEPVPRLMRSAWEMVRPLEDIKPRRKVSDPVHRKSDKLR